MSTSLLLIGYYHGLLLRYIDVDKLNYVMCSTGLLTANDEIYFSTSYSIHHKKYLLMEIARHMDQGNLLKFFQAVQEVCPQISCQMKKGNGYSIRPLFDCHTKYSIHSMMLRTCTYFILQLLMYTCYIHMYMQICTIYFGLVMAMIFTSTLIKWLTLLNKQEEYFFYNLLCLICNI